MVEEMGELRVLCFFFSSLNKWNLKKLKTAIRKLYLIHLLLQHRYTL